MSERQIAKISLLPPDRPLRFLTVALLNAALYLAYYFIYSLTPPFFLYGAFSSVLIIIAFIDIDRHVIYDFLNLAILLIGVLFCFVSPLPAWYDRPAGLFAASLPLLLTALITRGGIGLGDVEFAAAGGLLLGWRLSLFSLLIASVASAIYGLFYAFIKGKGLKAAIPYGPFLALGFTVAALYGGQIISAYCHLFFS